MMNIKKILLSALFLAGCYTASAQGCCGQPQSGMANAEKEFVPHWYVQAQAGVQNSLGEITWTKLFSPNAQVAVGYNFNKYFGARLNVNAWQSKAGSKINNKTYTWKNNYVAPQVDAVLNVSNLFGYNPTRVVTVSVFGGVGANIAFNNDEAVKADKAMIADRVSNLNDQYLHNLWTGTKTRFMGQFGAMVDFRLSDAVSLGIELNANTLNDNYNSKRGENSDWYFNALAGVKVNLGKTYKNKACHKCCHATPTPAPQVVEKPAPAPVVEKKETPAPAPAPVAKKEEPVVEKKVEPLRRDIFFIISSAKISTEEGRKVQEIADYLKANPNAKVTITGHADKGTGNKTINQRLSQQRANIVANELIQKYGIDASRIVKEAKGDTVQPFQVPQRNRVSICIAQ